MFYLTLAGYGFATLWQWLVCFRQEKPQHTWFVRVLWFVLALHAALLYSWIEVASGQNLSYANLANLVVWLSAVLLLMQSRQQPLGNLLLLVCPLNLLVMLVGSYFGTTPQILATGDDLWQLVHVWLALLAYSLVLMTLGQALLLYYQEIRLRRHSPRLLSRLLPPLTVMEQIYLQWLRTAFFLLSAFLLFLLASRKVGQLAWWQIGLSLSAWVVIAAYFSANKFTHQPPRTSLITSFLAFACLATGNALAHLNLLMP
jgi:ABC-type uncharacterized transport system permease subunit